MNNSSILLYVWGAILGDIVVITSQGDRAEYKLPKEQVEGYNGAEVLLKVTLAELEKYKV